MSKSLYQGRKSLKEVSEVVEGWAEVVIGYQKSLIAGYWEAANQGITVCETIRGLNGGEGDIHIAQ